MSAIYGGYINLALIAIGGIAFLLLVKISDTSVIHRSITVDEFSGLQARAPEKDENASIKVLYENAVMNGGFMIPKSCNIADFAKLNRFASIYNVQDSIPAKSNLLIPNSVCGRRLAADLNAFNCSSHLFLLMKELSHIKVIRC
ncbi:MAG: hypothetical protein KGH60_02915 [Candidatus Micrarchaeota archaeon]|nr:hypothetical protein [Candidatus Micrarchaeota archaeon]